jgi:chromatin remodeling complex protein RSC6
VWDYIKSNNLQNPENKREILADDQLKKVFGKDKVTMFEMNKYISQHVKA